jgi:hypothetical protein
MAKRRKPSRKHARDVTLQSITAAGKAVRHIAAKVTKSGAAVRDFQKTIPPETLEALAKIGEGIRRDTTVEPVPAAPASPPAAVRPIGRPRDYDHAGIAGLTEKYIQDHGLPRTQALLREKVADVCRGHKPHSIEVPGDTVFKDIVRPIWRRHRLKSRKVAN